MKRTVIMSLPQPREVIKEVKLSEDWESEYHVSERQSVREIIETRMRDRIDRYMEEIGCHDVEKRRNAIFPSTYLLSWGTLSSECWILCSTTRLK